MTVPDSTPDRILFGSCNSQHYESVLWPAIRSRNATAFVWAGDAIYADDFDYTSYWWGRKAVPRQATPQVLKSLYRNLVESPEYREVLEGNMTILGAIDDHDYGRNNGDINYEYKTESAMAYVDFLQQQGSSIDLSIMAERAAAGKGVYGVKVFDFAHSGDNTLLSDEEAGVEPSTSRRREPLSDRSVAIFTLDVRSNKTPWRQGWTKFFPDYEADFLEDEQWTWFEQVLERSTATINIIVQGLQVHADRYFDGNLVEDWSRFPMAQHRLYQTILQSSVQSPILVSGDVHMSEILRKDCRRGGHFDEPNSRLLLEVTASGMTHSWGTNICARPHSTWSCQSAHVARSLSMGMHLAHNNHAWTDVAYVEDANEGAKNGYQYVLERNFAEFEMDWENRRVLVRVLGEGVGKGPLLSTAWDLDVLSGAKFVAGGKVRPRDFDLLYQIAGDHGANYDDWICVNSGGHPTMLLKLFGVASPVLLAGFIMSLPVLLPLLLALVLIRPRKTSGCNT